LSVITSRASPKDASLIDIRPEDLAEIALYGLPVSPAEGIARSIAMSPEAWTARDAKTGEVVAIFGVGDHGSVKSPWLISSEGLRRHGRDALRIGRAVRNNLQRQADCGVVIKNYVSKQAAANRAFIERVGYVIEHIPDSSFDLFHLPPCATPS
jgi:hypothetical protein